MPGVWNQNEIAAYLAGARIPLRLGLAGADGWPRLVSLWFLPDEDGALWCATQATAQVTRLLTGDPRCAFEVSGDAPPYRGVRGTGTASLDPARGGEVLEALLARYGIDPASTLARRLRAKAASEVAIRIAVRTISSWDFSARMAGAVAGT